MLRWFAPPLFALLTALCAQISVPMTPVPMTLQSFAVVLAGMMLGWKGGLAAMLLYLLAGALGAPVFSDGGSGFAALTGPTAGYLIAFPVAAAAVGMFARNADLSRLIGLGLAGHLLILGLGAGWLAIRMGFAEALAVGFTPFLIGAGVKSLAAAGLTRGWRRLALRRA